MRGNTIHHQAPISVTKFHTWFTAALGVLTLIAPLSVGAQLHQTGFTYSITSKGFSHQQRIRNNGANTTDLQTTRSNLNMSNPSQYTRVDPSNPDISFLQQQTITNQRTEGRNQALIFRDNFSFSVFRNNQFQPPN
jgi:hypothetical protein